MRPAFFGFATSWSSEESVHSTKLTWLTTHYRQTVQSRLSLLRQLYVGYFHIMRDIGVEALDTDKAQHAENMTGIVNERHV